jgi:hypothetical protein
MAQRIYKRTGVFPLLALIFGCVCLLMSAAIVGFIHPLNNVSEYSRFAAPVLFPTLIIVIAGPPLSVLAIVFGAVALRRNDLDCRRDKTFSIVGIVGGSLLFVLFQMTLIAAKIAAGHCA